mgnify:CR=1 FL=1
MASASSIVNPILKALNGTYSTSIGDDGLIFSLAGVLANAKPQGSIKSLGILSKSYSFAPRLRYPIKRSRDESYYLEGGLNVARSETFLLDSSTTKDRLTVADFVFSVTNDVWFGGSTQLNFTIAQGLDLFGSRGESTSLPGPSIANFKQTFLKYLLPQFRCLSVDWEKLHEDIDKLDALKSLIVFQSTISNSNNELNLLLEIFSKILRTSIILFSGLKLLT